MKRPILYLIGGIFLIIVQTSLLPLFFGLTLRPDLILLIVLYIGLNETPIAGAFYSWLLGCILDVFCGTTLGLNGMIMLPIFYGTYLGAKKLNLKNDLIMLVATALGTLCNSVFLVLTLLCFSEQSQNSALILNRLPSQLFINLITVIIVTISLSTIRSQSQHRKRNPNYQGLSTWH